MNLGILAIAVAQSASVYTLPIGTSGTVTVRPHQMVDTANGKTASLKSVVSRAKGVGYVLLGESHDHPEHHELQASVIEALAKSGRDVVVGFEMFTRPAQSKLANWSLGFGSEEDFIQESGWKTEWGFDFGLYRPIFATVRKYRLPMVALNVPRTWVRAVAKEGYAGLTKEQQAELPADMDLKNTQHRSVFEAMMGGHGGTGASMDNMYAAQVLWDEGMADSALKAMARRDPTGKPIMVIVVGSGHVMYGQGINYRLMRQKQAKSISVVMVETNEPMMVAKGLGDFVYAAAEAKR